MSTCCRSREDIDGAETSSRVVCLHAVDASGGAVFRDGADGQRVAVATQGDRKPELVAFDVVAHALAAGVRRLE